MRSAKVSAYSPAGRAPMRPRRSPPDRPASGGIVRRDTVLAQSRGCLDVVEDQWWTAPRRPASRRSRRPDRGRHHLAEWHVPRILVGRQSEVHVEGTRRADLALEVLLERAARHATNELFHERADRQCVVPERGARPPQRSLGGQSRSGCGGIAEELLERDAGFDHRKAGLMREQLSDGDLLLAGDGELGPVGADLLGELEPSGVDERCDDHRRDAFGHREDAGQIVSAEKTSRQVGHRFTTPPDAELRAEAFVLLQVGLEQTRDGVEWLSTVIDRSESGWPTVLL